jgi:predicted metalloprotease with PDZ domain
MEYRKGLIVDEVPWFNEGIATYYQVVLPYRFGRVTKSQFLTEVNKVASAYYTSPVVHMSDREALERQFSDFHSSRLPYCRGATYFFKLDHELRTVSGGKRSLTEPILAFLKLKRKRKPYTSDQWLWLIEAELGEGALKDFENMQAGKLVIPPSDCLAAEGFKLDRVDQETFELGFDYDSLDELVIEGLVLALEQLCQDYRTATSSKLPHQRFRLRMSSNRIWP